MECFCHWPTVQNPLSGQDFGWCFNWGRAEYPSWNRFVHWHQDSEGLLVPRLKPRETLVPRCFWFQLVQLSVSNIRLIRRKQLVDNMATVVCRGKKELWAGQKMALFSNVFVTRPLLWAGFLAAASRHHHIVASGSKGRWLCWDPASMRRSPSRVPSRGGFEAMLGPSKLGRDMQRHVCAKYAHPYSYIKYIAMILLMEEIPNNHLTCMKPCKEWDIYHINCLTGFLFHQQYLYLQLNSPWFWSTPRWRGLSRCLEVGNNVSLRGVCYLSGGVKGNCIFLSVLMNFHWFWDQVGEDFARFCGACPQHERPRAQIWVTLVESETGDWCGFLDGWLPQIPLVHHASKKIATLQWFLMRQKYEQGMSNRWIIGVWRALNLLFTTQAALGMSEERVNWWLRLMTYFPSKP